MNVFRKSIFKRAIPSGLALFFSCTTGFAAKVETYQDLIEKAYNLSLQKDRAQAIHLLVSAAQRESKKGQTPKEILVALDEVSTIFYSDKAQQFYELALSLKASDPSLAAAKLAEAVRLEPENASIQLEQARSQIINSDCESASKFLSKIAERNPFSEEVRLTHAQALLCSGKLNEYQQIRTQVDAKKTAFEIYWLMTDLEQAFRSGSFAKGREIAAVATLLDSKFPETLYWTSKMAMGQKMPDEKSAKKYLTECQSLSPRVSRLYIYEPKLCKRVTEVEAEMKKNSSSGGTN